MQKSRLLLVLLLILFSTAAFADSPLTSTDFYTAYLDVPQVEAAVGVAMNGEIFDLLLSDEFPLDVKVAVINAMGWNLSGQENAADFMEMYMNETGLEAVQPEDMTGEELVCLAYLVSLDDYFSMSPIEEGAAGVLGMTGVELAELARERMADDFTARMISALILAQDAMEYDWGEVFTIVDFVMKEALVRNMRDDAIDIIMNYIGLYYEYR